MTGFRLNQRVKVLRCGRQSEWALPDGTTGTVSRLLMRDDSARIRLDKRLTGELEIAHDFPATDETRSTSVLAWPDDCEAL